MSLRKQSLVVGSVVLFALPFASFADDAATTQPISQAQVDAAMARLQQREQANPALAAAATTHPADAAGETPNTTATRPQLVKVQKDGLFELMNGSDPKPVMAAQLRTGDPIGFMKQGDQVVAVAGSQTHPFDAAPSQGYWREVDPKGATTQPTTQELAAQVAGLQQQVQTLQSQDAAAQQQQQPAANTAIAATATPPAVSNVPPDSNTSTYNNNYYYGNSGYEGYSNGFDYGYGPGFVVGYGGYVPGGYINRSRVNNAPTNTRSGPIIITPRGGYQQNGNVPIIPPGNAAGPVPGGGNAIINPPGNAITPPGNGNISQPINGGTTGGQTSTPPAGSSIAPAGATEVPSAPAAGGATAGERSAAAPAGGGGGGRRQPYCHGRRGQRRKPSVDEELYQPHALASAA